MGVLRPDRVYSEHGDSPYVEASIMILQQAVSEIFLIVPEDDARIIARSSKSGVEIALRKYSNEVVGNQSDCPHDIRSDMFEQLRRSKV